MQTAMSQVFKRMRKIAGKFSPGPPNILNVNGDKVSDGQAVANTLADTFYFVSSRVSRSPAVRRQFEEYEARQLDFSSGGDESYNVSLCKGSSPGSDNITYSMIRHLDSGSLSFLLVLFNYFNRMWSDGYVPPSYKSAIVIPIPKPGKDASLLLNY